MCGRYTLRTPLNQLVRQFALPFDAGSSTEYTPRYNIAPTQQAAMIRQVAASQRGGGTGETASPEHPAAERELAFLRWGLIPSWAKDPAIGNRMINARGETVAEKPSFRAAFRRRRCLAAADGYYEWRAGTKPKQPIHFHLTDHEPFALAGLWEYWEPPDGGPPIESFTIITTDANRTAAAYHDRMPAILLAEDYARWLDPQFTDTTALAAMIRPLPDEIPLHADAVSTYVNKPGNEGPQCLTG
ncbi:MAG: SOS response-associated peptidase [Pirellulales bacterium]